jgi:hypothetical protein
LRATARRNGYLDWPGLQQVCVLERTRVVAGAEETETTFAITSLPPERASAPKLLLVARQHGRIENQLHGVRDVSCGEDGCRVRTENAPEVLAGMRNATLTVLRASGVANIAAAFRHLAAAPLKAVQLVTEFVLQLL